MTQEVAAGTKPKATQFYLDTDRKRPYAMWFYTASDREFVYQGELNLMPAPIQAPVFYKSAGSWVAQIKGETVTFYDDTSDGVLFQTEPYKRGLKLYNLGQPTDGVAGPLFDSMRIGGGKAPRVPYSEFVKLGEEWFHLRGVDEGTKVGVRPLNPEYFKTGKVQLKWGGGKKTQPAFLAIKGRGQIATAMFDVGSGKEIEVPAGAYEICFGRVISGKGSRSQMASIFRGKAEPFQVEAGKLFTLEMGAPFALEFQRGGNDKEVEIEAPKITLHDRSGAVYADLFNAVLYPEVVASRSETGKGAKVIGEFIRMNDPEFVDAASRKEEWKNLGRGVIAFPRPKGSRRGDMTLKAKLPFKDAKVGLRIKRHPLFGKIGSEFK